MSECPRNNLKFILNKRYDQTFTMKWFANTPDKLSSIQPNNVRRYSTGTLKGISKIIDFSDSVDGENDQQFLKRFFRYKSGNSWSSQKPIEEISTIEVDYRLEFELEIIYYYAYNVDPTKYSLSNIFINSILVNGEYALSVVDAEALLDADNTEVILKPKDIYKVFRLDGFEITKQDTGNVDYKIFYRFTQNGGRTYTPFEPLTEDNIKTLKLDEMRFAEVEYLIQFKSSGGALMIYDIMLLGDFQNITANYIKTNRYGIKEECISYLLNNGACVSIGPSGNGGNGDGWTNSDSSMAYDDNDYTGLNLYGVETQGLSCYNAINDLTYNQDGQGVGEMWGVGGYGGDSSGLIGVGSCDTADYWNPYKIKDITGFYNMLATQMNGIFGWKVNYFITDPDGNGVDRYMHEYQLKHVEKVAPIKIIVPKNNFPDETIALNYFNLDLFDTFEINILKDEFKRAFGIEKRPSQDDIIHICVTNKLYYIKHTQAYKDIMNTSIHYKIILEKYEKRADINVRDEESKNILDSLQKNTDLEDLLGVEKRQEEKKVANKEQTFSLAYDTLRQKIYKNVDIINESIYNDSILISKNHYDLSKVDKKPAIDYNSVDLKLTKGENRSFIEWFNFKSSYDENKRLSKDTFKGYQIDDSRSYLLLNNFDDDNNLGYKIFAEKGFIFLQLNDKTYEFPVELNTDIWYGLLVNLNQRQEKLEFKLYKRNTDIGVIMFNNETYEKKELITYTDIDEAYDPDNTGYTYIDALSDGFLAVKNYETNLYGKLDSSKDKLSEIATLSIDIEPTEFEHNEHIKIEGSPIKITNIRILSDIVPENKESNILSQYIFGEEQHLIMADNCNREIKAIKHYHRRFD